MPVFSISDEDGILSQQQPWQAIYPSTARNFDDTKVRHHHMAEVLGAAAGQFGTQPAVTTQLPNGACATLNFEQVNQLTDDFAVYLRDVIGVKKGEVIALMSPNCISFMLAAFGVFKAGCILTNVNPLYTAPEVEHQLKDSQARVLVIADLFGDKADQVVPGTAVEHVVTISLTDFFPPLKRAVMDFVLRRVRKVVPAMQLDHVGITRAIRQGAGHRARHGTDIPSFSAGQSSDDVALYQYTGGTTGRSKGAELTHGNILANAVTTMALIEDSMEEGGGDVSLVALPLYHITAFVLIMLPCLLKGALALMIPSPRPPLNLKPAFENFRVTHFSGINTLFAALLEEPWCTADALKHLKLCSSGGAAQLVAVAERWEKLTGLPIHQGYGLTECTGCLTLNPMGANRLGSAGVPIPLTTVKIVGDAGEDLPVGSIGEVVARGPTIMKGYLGQPEATAATLKDGWLQTGDIGCLDEDGYLQIVDRKKDMILVSGFNVYPNEVEDVIVQLEGVLEVGVIGVPDEKTTEAVKAYVVSSDPGLTAEKIIDHCRVSLTNYKRPRAVAFIDEIPKSPIGKVLRRELRKLDAP